MFVNIRFYKKHIFYEHLRFIFKHIIHFNIEIIAKGKEKSAFSSVILKPTSSIVKSILWFKWTDETKNTSLFYQHNTANNFTSHKNTEWYPLLPNFLIQRDDNL